MKRFQLSDRAKWILGILNKICLFGLAMLFFNLVSIYMSQEQSGQTPVMDYEGSVRGDYLEATEFADSIEDALVHGITYMNAYQCKITEEIYRMRNKDLLVVYYRAVNGNEESFVYANFRVLEKADGTEQYGFVSSSVEVRSEPYDSLEEMQESYEKRDVRSILGSKMHGAKYEFINMIDENQDLDKVNDYFIGYVDICEEHFADNEDVYTLRFDGKVPDDIVEYECFGKKYYFLYFEDVNSTGNVETERFTFDTTTQLQNESNQTVSDASDKNMDKKDLDTGQSVEPLSSEEQIKVFAKEVALWSKSSDQTIWFTIADMNLDKQLEIITDSIQGSGRFAYNTYHVVGADGSLEALEQEHRFGLYLSTYYPEEDGVITVPVYHDTITNRYYSIQGTGSKGAPTSFQYSLHSMWIEDGKVNEEHLGSRLHETEEDSNEKTVTYEDAEDNAITEAEFEELAEQKYYDLWDMQMVWKWQRVPREELAAMSQEEVEALLWDCYENFKMLQPPVE